MLGFSHDNNSMTYTSAELVSLLRVLARYYIGDKDGGWHDWPHRTVSAWKRGVQFFPRKSGIAKTTIRTTERKLHSYKPNRKPNVRDIEEPRILEAPERQVVRGSSRCTQQALRADTASDLGTLSFSPPLTSSWRVNKQIHG